MPSPPPPDRAPDPEGPRRTWLVEELERRIVELEAVDDAEIGSFTGRDWMACVTGAVVIPALVLWWFAA